MRYAQYYTYRNLNAGGFSTKHYGSVSHRNKSPLLIENGIFRVSALGNQRARNDHRRNVHAYIVSFLPPTVLLNDGYSKHILTDKTKYLVQVRYNPFKHTKFMLEDDELHFAEEIYLVDGKCFVNRNAKITTY